MLDTNKLANGKENESVFLAEALEVEVDRLIKSNKLFRGLLVELKEGIEEVLM